MDPRRLPAPDAARAISVALVFFGALAALAWSQGVFERLDPEVRWSLAVFALAFVALTCRVDSEVRAYLRTRIGFRKAPGKSPAAKRAAT